MTETFGTTGAPGTEASTETASGILFTARAADLI
jgi:hypothetical protein